MVEILPRSRVNGVVSATLKAAGEDFVSKPVDQLDLTYSGIKDDFHAGLTRSAGAREPWYESGVEMRNERQISILSVEELSQMATALDIDAIEPGWIGANLVIDGIKDLSLLPPRTVLKFEGGVSLRVDGYNAPCRIAGQSIVDHLSAGGSRDTDKIFATKTEDIALEFRNAGHMKRGLVAWVEREGTIRPGEKLMGLIWEQWLYK